MTNPFLFIVQVGVKNTIYAFSDNDVTILVLPPRSLLAIFVNVGMWRGLCSTFLVTLS